VSGSNINVNDDMIRRLDTELRQKETFGNGIVERANQANRDLNESERELMAETRGRMEEIKEQIDELEKISKVAYEVRNRAAQVGQEIDNWRGQPTTGKIEYRTAGEYIRDLHKSALGGRDATDRLEIFNRAAAHQKTSDNPGLIPDPIIGPVINFIDAARPIVTALGPKPLTSQIWHRPVVTQQPTVAKQGVAGLAADEKTELVSQKMVITKLTAEALTYGGYVNVSRQNLDFSTPGVLEQVVEGLSSAYAIETEGAVADKIATTTTTAVGYGTPPHTAADVAGALWEAAGKAYTAVKNQGSLVLAVSPTVLGTFGPLFAPVNPQNAYSTGFSAGDFGSGVVGSISGIKVVMSAGLATGEAFLLSTAALEVYEQRIGTLQVTEPSVLGMQVAYAGYFTPLIINDDAIIPLTAT
jgi:HK97 family phage major capsid protein